MGEIKFPQSQSSIPGKEQCLRHIEKGKVKCLPQLVQKNKATGSFQTDVLKAAKFVSQVMYMSCQVLSGSFLYYINVLTCMRW